MTDATSRIGSHVDSFISTLR